MTDEEMAEEYALKNRGLYTEGQDDCTELKRAFLAGLKAGRPKWHKVADGDLPPRSSHVVLNQDGDHVIYHTTLKKWFWTDGCYSGLKVITWCEIPKFEED